MAKKKYEVWWQATVRKASGKVIGYINMGSLEVSADNRKTATESAGRAAKELITSGEVSINGCTIEPRINALICPAGQIHQIRKVKRKPIMQL